MDIVKAWQPVLKFSQEFIPSSTWEISMDSPSPAPSPRFNPMSDIPCNRIAKD